MYRETWAEIDLNALAHNVECIESSTHKSLIGVVKANAYGHGDIQIARHLETLGVTTLGVSSLDEAWRLINAGIKTDILIFSYVDPKIIEEANHSHFVYTIPSIDWYTKIQDIKTPLRLHMEINVGMNRYGFTDLKDMEAVLNTHHNLEGVYVHLQNPENLEVGSHQIHQFLDLVSKLNHDFKIISIGNAPTTLVSQFSEFSHVRVGIGMYGYRHDIDDLKPVLSLYSNILYKESIVAGATVGYDYAYRADEDHIVGTVPIGYADGFDMRNNACPLYISGQPADILGKICMDQTMIRIDDTVSINDRVEIIGPNRSVSTISKMTGISMYVVITSLAPRIERRYILDSKIIATIDR